MMYVALAAIVALVVTSAAWATFARSLIRQQARERGLLIDQLCNLAGRPWNTPPAAEPPPVPDEFVYVDPSQLPDY